MFPRSIPRSCGAISAALMLVGMLVNIAGAQQVPKRIEMELLTAEGFRSEDTRPWIELLASLNVENVRIRSPKDGDQLGIRIDGTTAHITGQLLADGRLSLPKGKFYRSDKASLSTWLSKLTTGGEEAITDKPVHFGLFPRQFVETHDALAVRVDFVTEGKLPRDVLKSISERITLSFVTDTNSKAALASEEPMTDELLGLASGTAIAATLRPLGLVMVPELSSGKVRLRIKSSTEVTESWPIGWPSESTPRELCPDLFKFLNVEVSNTPVGESMKAIAGRLKLILLVDHNGLARGDIDLAKTKVSLPKTNTFYARALERLLFQAKLKHELRIDEAGTPFLWVSPLR